MINHDKTGLQIFDNFHIDFNLPKWKLRQYSTSEGGTVPDMDSGPRFNRFNRSRFGNVVSGITLSPDSNWTVSVTGASGDTANKNSVGLSVKNTFDKLFGREKKRKKIELQRIEEEAKKANFSVNDLTSNEPNLTNEISAKEFFESIKNSAEELELANERFLNYEKSIAYLKRTGQIAILERMEYDLEIHRAETQLYATGFRKLVTEANVVEFASKSCRELRLDWIKNFTRLIPEKVLEAKEKCDENHIFDNYVIMHYDPYKDGVLKTLNEIEAEKDPILFGVIAGSNKLYYIGDWVDEYCNLTFDKLVEKLGEDAINANDLTAEIKITRS